MRFWRLLRDGVDPIVEVPRDRWDADAYYAEDREAPGKMVTRWGGFLSGLDRFEPSFFGISPRETATLDPQQRVVLEVAWEALEDAGQPPGRLAGSRTGVYVGTHTNDYSWMLFTDTSSLDVYASTGTARSIVANRLSYLFDLRGPSVAVDTACSSSLVAVHLACQALRDGECDLALAGGVNLLHVAALERGAVQARHPRSGRALQDLRRARRRLSCAARAAASSSSSGSRTRCADGDRVLARCIRGTATTRTAAPTGSRRPTGSPSRRWCGRLWPTAACAPARSAWSRPTGPAPRSATPSRWSRSRQSWETGESRCLLGAVKTNIGHCEGAAGIAGLIKVALSLHHEAVPGLVHFRELNPHVNLAGTRFAIPRTLEPWPRGGGRRFAGVSAFGFGAVMRTWCSRKRPPQRPHRTRRHAACTCFPSRPAATRDCGPSRARTRNSSPTRATASTSAISVRPRRCGASTIHTGGPWWEPLPRSSSRGWPKPPRRRPRLQTRRAALAFVFSGQGNQWPEMARDLLLREPAFRQLAEACDALVRTEAGWSLLDVLEAGDETRLAHTEFAQPAIFAVQVGLAAVLASWGVVPGAVTGHSVGEVAAAHVAGALTLADAVRVVVQRARLMQRAEGRGRMASVDIPEAEAIRTIAAASDRLAVAAVNAPGTTVLAGDSEALAAVVDDLERRGVACQWLAVDYAFHSPQMDPLRALLVDALHGLTSTRPKVPLISTVTGDVVADAELAAGYWGRNLREPVRLAKAIDTVAELGVSTFIELGPHPALGGAIARTLKAHQRSGSALASLRRGHPGDAALLTLIGRLWERGHAVDWAALHSGRRRWVALPPTPWERESHPPRFGEPTVGVAAGVRAAETAGGHPLLARRLATAQPTYETRLDREAPAYLADHRINGASIVPATALVEMALHAGTETLGTDHVRLEDLVIRRPLPFDGTRVLQVTVVRRYPRGRAGTHLQSGWRGHRRLDRLGAPRDGTGPGRGGDVRK